MARLTDTSPDVERQLARCYRAMSLPRKWLTLVQAHRFARHLHAAGYRQRHPESTQFEVYNDWLRTTLPGMQLPTVSGLSMEPTPPDFHTPLAHVIAVFDRLGIRYAIGGSLASSLHGYPRMTLDADISAELTVTHLSAFVGAFDAQEYYLSDTAVAEAIRTGVTFNVLHPTTGYKIDIFVQADAPFERSAMQRRQLLELSESLGKPVYVQAPEAIVLFKLRWYRLGGEVSDHPWNDILGVLRTQQGRLDEVYLDEWATHLGIADLLNRARGEV